MSVWEGNEMGWGCGKESLSKWNQEEIIAISSYVGKVVLGTFSYKN